MAARRSHAQQSLFGAGAVGASASGPQMGLFGRPPATPTCDRVHDDASLEALVRRKIPTLGCQPFESFVAVPIDAHGCAQVIKVCDGQNSQCEVRLEDLRKALDRAPQAAFVHNHPSGTIEPSFEDEDTTARLARLFDPPTRVVRHLILTGAARGACRLDRWQARR